MKAIFAAAMGKACKEKWTVNEPGVFYFTFSLANAEKKNKTKKKTVAGVARRVSIKLDSLWYPSYKVHTDRSGQ